MPLSNRPVPTIDQTYRDNLGLLVKEAGSQEALSTLTGKSPAQISQWLNASKDSKTGKPRNMARATAREIERKCGKPEGWMDQQHDLAQEATVEVRESPASYAKYARLLLDLEDIPPAKRSKLMDLIHEAAEEAREAAAHFSQRDGKTSKSSPARRGSSKSSTTVSYGDGNRRQRFLPLSTVPDPFTAEPNERESALYRRIERAPK